MRGTLQHFVKNRAARLAPHENALSTAAIKRSVSTTAATAASGTGFSFGAGDWRVFDGSVGAGDDGDVCGAHEVAGVPLDALADAALDGADAAAALTREDLLALLA